MPPCMGIGQAAGTAVAMALNNTEDLRKLNVCELRERLRGDGVVLDF